MENQVKDIERPEFKDGKKSERINLVKYYEKVFNVNGIELTEESIPEMHLTIHKFTHKESGFYAEFSNQPFNKGILLCFDNLKNFLSLRAL